MALQSGKYIVSNNGASLFIGRSTNEVADLLPKSIITLPGGVQAPIWIVERLENGRYKLAVLRLESLQARYVAEIDGKVFAILDPEGPVKPTEWTIQSHSANAFLVETPSGNVWAVPEKKESTQVILETPIESIPLLHSPSQLFTFSPVLEDRDD